MRERKRQPLKISQLSRSRVAHLLSTANYSGPIIARKTRSFRSRFRIRRFFNRSIDGETRYCPGCFVVGQAEPPSKRIFHEPSGCLTHVEVKVPICAPASSKTGPLENPRSPAAFVTTRSGCQRKGATAGLKNSDQSVITS